MMFETSSPLIKSAVEIDVMRQAGHVVAYTLDALKTAIDNGERNTLALDTFC